MNRCLLLARSGAVLMTAGVLATGCFSATTSTQGDPTKAVSTRGNSTAQATPPSDTATSSSSPAVTGSPPAPPPAPKEGECRALGYAEISRFSDATKTEPCSDPHTAYTFAVGRLPADIAFEGVSIENGAVQDAAATDCRASFGDFIGGDAAARALSRLTVTYFLPDQRGFDAGAHWVRCDVIALQSEKALAELPRDLQGFLDDERNLEEFAVCSKGEPGLEASRLVMCRQKHTYRALAALRLGASEAPYPGRRVTKVEGKQRCEAVLEAELGIGGGYTYAWTYPTSRDWDAGQRFGYCWNRTIS